MAVFQKILAGTCELTTSAFTPVTTMPVFTGDDNGAVISVSFTEDGAAYTIPLDVDVKAYLFYDAKNAMTEAYTMTVDGDTASLDVPDAFTAVSGNPQCIIMMIDDNANVTKVCAFSFPVKRTTSDTIIYLAPPSPDTIVYIGRAPYVCELGTWCVWDNDTRQYVDSGISAAGNYTVFVKWSAINPTQDSDMSDTPNAWMGIYTGLLVTAPTTYTSYRWYKVKGEKGDDVASAYVHIRWGTSATPETLLTAPDAYIGIASTSSATAPADYTGYSWYLYKGVQGDPGDAGTSAYVHIRWGTSLTPATLLAVPDEYIGIASTSSATAPADYTGYAWYKYKGDPGETVTVVDNLASDSTTSALSAAQGKALNLAKASKAASPTAGHIATLDASGNPVDSTKSLSDLATAAQGGKADTAIQVSDLLSKIYPVGSIYMSVVNTSPASFLGGTWSAWGAGRVPVGVDTTQTEFNTVEKTGGEKAHTLTAAELAAHRHYLCTSTTGGSGSFDAYAPLTSHIGGSAITTGIGILTASAGSDSAHNNLQPYITCYMWKRIA